MLKQDVYKQINDFAPYNTAEKWDCSGWIVDNSKKSVEKVMLCLTVTDDIVEQAEKSGCDLILSHHPLFFVPLKYKDINILCAHTNLDKAIGGTTDTLIAKLGLSEYQEAIPSIFETEADEFVRYVNLEKPLNINDFIKLLHFISPNLRYVNNNGVKTIKKIAFCAGSGSEFINDAYLKSADAYVTGDMKFHTALESPIVVFDIGHFESEILILDVFKKLLPKIDFEVADEKSPFIYHG